MATELELAAAQRAAQELEAKRRTVLAIAERVADATDKARLEQTVATLTGAVAAMRVAERTFDKAREALDRENAALQRIVAAVNEVELSEREQGGAK